MGDAPIANWQTSQWIFLSQKTSYHTLPGLWTWVVFFQQKLTLFFSLRYNHNLPFFSLPIISFQPKQENNRLYLASISLEEPLKEGGGRKRLPSFNFQCVATRSGHCSKAGRATPGEALGPRCCRQVKHEDNTYTPKRQSKLSMI